MTRELDRIPFGSTSRIVGNGHGQAATVAAAGVSKNEQLAGTTIAGRAFLVPPMGDGMNGKGGGIVGNADHQSAAIFQNIINSIGDGDPDGIGAEVMIIDATRGRFPTTSRIFEIADEFAFFVVHADDGQMTALESVAQFGEIFELELAVGTVAGGDLLVIDPQGLVHFMEQAGDGIGRDWSDVPPASSVCIPTAPRVAPDLPTWQLRCRPTPLPACPQDPVPKR